MKVNQPQINLILHNYAPITHCTLRDTVHPCPLVVEELGVADMLTFFQKTNKLIICTCTYEER